MSIYVLSVNGAQHRLTADPEMPLLWALRDLLHLTGTKYGCGIGACGACTVHENGKAVRSCQVTLSATTGKQYTTIEGLSLAGPSVDGMHPCQQAWTEEDVSQCGYCQVGMIMEAAALVCEVIRNKSKITDKEIDDAFSGHVCRCGTYQRVRRAVLASCGESCGAGNTRVAGV